MRVLYVKLKKHLLGGNLRFLTFSFFSFVFCMYVALTFECWFLLFWEHSLTLMCLDCMKLLMFWVICWWLDWALPKLRLWSWLVFICWRVCFAFLLLCAQHEATPWACLIYLVSCAKPTCHPKPKNLSDWKFFKFGSAHKWLLSITFFLHSR